MLFGISDCQFPLSIFRFVVWLKAAAFLQLPHSFHVLPVILCISAFAATTTATRSSEAEAALVPELPDNRVTQDRDP